MPRLERRAQRAPFTRVFTCTCSSCTLTFTCTFTEEKTSDQHLPSWKKFLFLGGWPEGEEGLGGALHRNQL